MVQQKAVDYRFKLLYAIGILMVVGGHVEGYGGVSLFQDWFPFYGLHLPLFAFSSGYFYKKESENHAGRYIWKKVKKLIIPLYLYNLAYGLLVQLLRLSGFRMGYGITLSSLLVFPITNGHHFTYTMGGWFVAPLFMIEVAAVLYRKLFGKVFRVKNPEHIFFWTAAALGVLGNLLAIRGYLGGWWLVLVRMLHLLPFFGLGVYYRSTLEARCRKIPSGVYLAVVVGVKLLLSVWCGRVPKYTASWCNDFIDGPVMPVLIGFLGIAFWMRLADRLAPVMGRHKWVNLLADNAYSIMMNQFAGFLVVNLLYRAANLWLGVFESFRWESVKSSIWYYYTPGGLPQTLILYTIGGILFSLLVQKVLDGVKKGVRAAARKSRKPPSPQSEAELARQR